MTDRELIEKLIEGTYARIEGIARSLWQQADAETEAGMKAQGLTPKPVAPREVGAALRQAWRAPLTDVAVHLLQAAAETAAGNEILIDDGSLSVICSSIPKDELRRLTGIPDQHIQWVLFSTAFALWEIVNMQASINVEIDRTPYRLRAA